MIPPDHDQALDALLRRSSEIQSIPDDGFSARVLAALPAPQQATTVSQNRRRGLVCVVGGSIGALLAISQGSRLPPLTSVGDFWVRLADDSLRASSQMILTVDGNLAVLAQVAVALLIAAVLLIQRPGRSHRF